MQITNTRILRVYYSILTVTCSCSCSVCVSCKILTYASNFSLFSHAFCNV